MSQNTFHSHLAAFRGLAIITIVAAHSWSFAIFWTGGLNGAGLSELFWTTEVLFHGSTLYFAVLSGLLYSLVLHNKSWPVFFHSKLLNVALPYLVLSVFTSAYYYPWNATPEPEQGFWSILGMNILTGNAMIHFWYVLVLFVLFAITPVLAKLLARRRTQYLLVLLACLPLMISRSPFPDFLKPQSFVYFTGAYALGILWGHHYQTCQGWIKKYQVPLLVTVVLASMGIWFTYYFDMPQDGVFSLRQSLVYVQKVVISALVIAAFETRHQDKGQPKWLLTLSEYSFAIYFLHTFFIGHVIISLLDWLNAHRDPGSIALVGSVNLIAGVLGALTSAWLLKRILGKHARKIIGA